MILSSEIDEKVKKLDREIGYLINKLRNYRPKAPKTTNATNSTKTPDKKTNNTTKNEEKVTVDKMEEQKEKEKEEAKEEDEPKQEEEGNIKRVGVYCQSVTTLTRPPLHYSESQMISAIIMYTVEPLIKEPPNKGRNSNNLSIMDAS